MLGIHAGSLVALQTGSISILGIYLGNPFRVGKQAFRALGVKLENSSVDLGNLSWEPFRVEKQAFPSEWASAPRLGF